MTYRKPGFERRSVARQRASIPALIKIMKGEPVEMKKKRKERTKETRPRNQPERELRNKIITELIDRGIVVMRVENSIFGRRNTGIPDLWYFNETKARGGWLEVKVPGGPLTGNQPRFKQLCELCLINHYVVHSVLEAIKAVG